MSMTRCYVWYQERENLSEKVNYTCNAHALEGEDVSEQVYLLTYIFTLQCMCITCSYLVSLLILVMYYQSYRNKMHKPGNFERIAVRNTIVKFCMSVNIHYRSV